MRHTIYLVAAVCLLLTPFLFQFALRWSTSHKNACKFFLHATATLMLVCRISCYSGLSVNWVGLSGFIYAIYI